MTVRSTGYFFRTAQLYQRSALYRNRILTSFRCLSSLSHHISDPINFSRTGSIQSPTYSFVKQFVEPAYPNRFVWSLSDLTSNPQQQREIRGSLHQHSIDEFDFLRWRNALLASGLHLAIVQLTHDSVPTPSIFQRGGERGGVTPSALMARLKLSQNHPSWLIFALIIHKIHNATHLSLALELSRPYISDTSLGYSRVKIIQHLIKACVHFSLFSALPRLLDLFAIQPHIELDDYIAVLRALLKTPPGEPRVRTLVQGGEAEVSPSRLTTLYHKDAQILRILNTMRNREIPIDSRTVALIMFASPSPSYEVTVFLRDHVQRTKQIISSSILISFAASIATAGKPLESGRILDLVRRRDIANKSPVIPISSGYSKKAYNRPSGQLDSSKSATDEEYTSSSSTSLQEAAHTPPKKGKKRSVRLQRFTRLNSIQLLSFARDWRSRDPSRFPHALLAYFHRLQSLQASLDLPKDDPRRVYWDAKMWSTLFVSLSKQAGFGADRLMSSFNLITGETGGFVKLNMIALTALVFGLVRRGAYKDALQIWETHLSILGPSLDIHAITAGVRVLTESGRLVEAFDLFNGFARATPPVSIDIEDEETRIFQDPEASSLHNHSKPRLDVALITDFMRVLGHIGRPDAVYELWEHMESMYGVRPNGKTLNVIVTVASTYSTRARAGGFLDMLGWRRSGTRFTLPPEGDEYPKELAKHIRLLLEDTSKPPVGIGFWWGDVMAWQRGRDIFRDVILGNWPELADITPPAVANAEGFNPILSSFIAFKKKVPLPEDSIPDSNSSPLHVSVGKYFDVVPTRRAFDAYMRLLCEHGLEHEIPEALAWQRALGIEPSRHTLRLALLCFAEVGGAAPFMVDVMGQAPEKSPYGALRKWVREWVGPNNCPTEFEISRARVLRGAEKGSPPWKELEKEQEGRKARFRRNPKDLRDPSKRMGKLRRKLVKAARGRQRRLATPRLSFTPIKPRQGHVLITTW